MKTFLTNVGDKNPLPEYMMRDLFKLTEEQIQNFKALKKTIYYVLAAQIEGVETSYGKLTVQICYADEHYYDNNSYGIFLCNEEEIKFAFSIPSLLSYPPVWDRLSGFDYSDYLNIQYKIKIFLFQNKIWERFIIDTSPNGKILYSVKESKEELNEILAKSGKYTVLALFAEKFPDNVEVVRKNAFTRHIHDGLS